VTGHVTIARSGTKDAAQGLGRDIWGNLIVAFDSWDVRLDTEVTKIISIPTFKLAALAARRAGANALLSKYQNRRRDIWRFRHAVQRWLDSMRGRRSRLLAWWYVAIAIGFVLLAIVRAILGEKLWLIGIRVILALGFAALAAMEFRAQNKGR
jgi:hypothetical protein